MTGMTVSQHFGAAMSDPLRDGRTPETQASATANPMNLAKLFIAEHSVTGNDELCVVKGPSFIREKHAGRGLITQSGRQICALLRP